MFYVERCLQLHELQNDFKISVLQENPFWFSASVTKTHGVHPAEPVTGTMRLNHQFWARPHSSKQIFHLPIQLQEHGGRGRSRGSTFSREKPVESQEAYSLHYNISSV